MAENFFVSSDGSVIQGEVLAASRGLQANTLYVMPDSTRPIQFHFEGAPTATQVRDGFALIGHHQPESRDELTESVDEIREEIMSVAGGRVDICNDDGSLNRMQEILGTLADLWEDDFTREVSDDDINRYLAKSTTRRTSLRQSAMKSLKDSCLSNGGGLLK